MTTHLKHKEQFQEILRHYKVSDHGIAVLHKVNFVGMLGITSSGRNTIMDELVEGGEFTYIVSDTTRPPRKNNGVLENNGEVYWFREEEEVLQDLKDGLFLEAELIHDQQVSGVSIRELERASVAHKIAITDIDHEGVHNILQVKPDATIILTISPSFKEWMRRFESRGTMSEVEAQRRFTTAVTMLDFVKNNYTNSIQCVINDDLNVAAAQVAAISRGEISLSAQRKEVAAVIAALKSGAEEYLARF
jgi:guanylate kinase